MIMLHRSVSLVAVSGLLLVGGTRLWASARRPQIKLIGPRISGRVPKGSGALDLTPLPQRSPTVEVRVRNVDLPDNTTLEVFIRGVSAGTLTLTKGSGELVNGVTPPGGVSKWDVLDVRTMQPDVADNNERVILSARLPWR